VTDARVKREEELHALAINELKEVQKAATAEMTASFDKLRAETAKLGRKVDELNRRLGE